jgi:hypothetical protein
MLSCVEPGIGTARAAIEYMRTGIHGLSRVRLLSRATRFWCERGSAVTWKDELSQAHLSRESFYHIAIASDEVLAIAGASSVARWTFSMRRDGLDFVAFCFAKPQDAEAFCEQFGGERLVPHLRLSGDNVAAPSPSALEVASRLGSDRAQREEFRGVVPSRKPHPTEDEHRALQLLAGSPCGATEEVLVLRHGFKLQMLTGLVRAKLAKRCRVTVKGGGRTTGVTYMMITASGRKAVKGF